ncbi:ATP-binding protein [Streptomyces sp. NPDC056367]|uniref:ATP-binding protein n=1 Tax=Streptomyces sp. NPDC056367 TaxID=3345797 RepID=UPI0035D6EA79
MSASPTPFRPSAIALLLTAVGGGTLATAAVAAAPSGVQAPLGWFAGFGVLLLAASAFAVSWYSRTARKHRSRAEALARELASRDAYLAHVTHEAGREAAARQQQHAAETAALEAARADAVERLTREHAERTAELVRSGEAGTARLEADLRRAESGRAAALAAAANAAGRMQALATSMLADLRDMEHRHADEDVLADLLHLDHRTAQAGRLADSVAVLSGARSGRRWARPIVMESVLRGAMGRIGGYQRVRLHSTSEAAVAGHAAEGVMHALAELMDNAANFSPPTAEVHVYVEEVPAGVIITVEDSGLVMSDVQLRRAEAAVGSDPQDLAGLSGTRLGLAVVGRLARKYGLTVSFRPSARGGTGALMLIPQDLISRTPAVTPAAPTVALPPAPARAVPAPGEAPGQLPSRTSDRLLDRAPARVPAARTAPDSGGEPEAVHDGPGAGNGLPGEAALPADGALPRRKRGSTMAAAHPDGPEAAAARARTETPRSGAAAGSVARFGSFRQAVRGTGQTGPVVPGPEAPGPEAPGSEASAPGEPASEPTVPPRESASPNSPHPEGNPR